MNAWLSKLLFTSMTKLFELRKLTNDFYNDFPEESYPELEHKINRPYVVLLIEINGLKYAVPLRTNIRHSYCYKFRTSDRETNSVTGVDFSKAVVIRKDSYVGLETSINDKEYLELQEKAFFIVGQFKKYVNGYIDYCKNGGNEYVARRYQYSTLKYFEEIINEKK